MIRLIKWFAIAGGLIPFVLILIGFVELYIDIIKIPVTTIYAFYLWPSRIMLLGQHENVSLGGFIGLGLSIFVNVLLYAALGLVIGLLWKVFALMRFVALPRKTRPTCNPFCTRKSHSLQGVGIIRRNSTPSSNPMVTQEVLSVRMVESDGEREDQDRFVNRRSPLEKTRGLFIVVS